MSDLRAAVERLADHDANAEGRDIYNRGRDRVAVGWLWLTWQFGIGADYDPHGQDGPWWGPWASLGPLSIGVMVYSKGGDR